MVKRRTRVVMVTCLIGGSFVASARADAQTASCAYDSSSHTVLIQTAPSGSGYAERILHLLGEEILFQGEPCQGATLTNTDSIEVTGIPNPSFGEAFFVRGIFVPGLTPEPEGQPEIEISVDLVNLQDLVGAADTDGDNRLTIGTLGIAVNSEF